MFRIDRNLILLVALALLAAKAVAGETVGAVASTGHQLRPKGAHLTLGEALLLADEAISRKVPNEGYKASAFGYRCTKKNGCIWGFEYHSDQESMTLFVDVDDRTRIADVGPHVCEEISHRPQRCK